MFLNIVKTNILTMAPNISSPANDIQHQSPIFPVLGQVARLGCMGGLSIIGKVMFKLNNRCQDLRNESIMFFRFTF